MLLRIYKNYLERLAVGLVLLIEVERTQGKQFVQALLNGWQTTTPFKAYIAQYGEQWAYPNGEDVSNEEILAGMFGQLLKRKGEDLDLLDSVVRILQLPYLHNYLGPQQVKDLREAVLVPSEHTKLKEATKAAFKCSCGHEFRAGEMLTFHSEGGVPTIICHKCCRPSTMRCDYCHNAVSLTAKALATHAKPVDCGCQTTAKDGTDILAAAQETARLQQVVRQREAVRRLDRERAIIQRNAPVPTATPGRLTPNMMRGLRDDALFEQATAAITNWTQPPAPPATATTVTMGTPPFRLDEMVEAALEAEDDEL